MNGTDPRIGTSLAGYRIQALLDRGGMSVVYLAEDPRLERRIALKLLPSELAGDERFRARFLRESRLAASIDHPSIVPVFDAGEADEQLYIAERYVEGAHLGRLIEREGPLEPARAVAIVTAVAAALDAAHARRLVHRDVKPSNILVAAEGGHAYLCDFGVSRLEAGSDLTETGQVVGTVSTMAPEQIQGRPVDGRADVYSLGCVLFEALAGEPPFARETQVATLVAHLQEPPPSLAERRRDLPSAIDAVIMRALAKSPGDRYAIPSELARAAAAALGVGPAPAASAAPPPRSLEDHCELVLDTLLGGRLVPVLGAGVTLPPRDDLATHLAGAFGVIDDGGSDLARVSQLVAVLRGEGPLHDELHDLLDTDDAPGAVHGFLASLPPLLRRRGAPHQLIVTTGWDTVLESAFAAAGEAIDVVTYISDGPHRGKFWHLGPDGDARLIEVPNTYAAELSLEQRTVILKVHGQVDRQPEREHESFVVTEDDYIDYLAQADVSNLVPVALAARLRRSHFLFLGYGLRDWSVRVMLHRLFGGGPLGYRSWAVLHRPKPIERELWRLRDVEVVDASLDDYFATLAARLPA